MFKDNYPSGAPLSATISSVRFYVGLLQILGLALAYLVTGKLGAFLAIPPGYATAIWPPSGIALAGILIYGYRVWPGILLGSFLVNFSTSVIGPPSEVLISVAITLAISSGASLQAIIGAYLVRRFGRFPNPLATEKDVFYLFFFGGILSTLINSTLAVSTLMAAARIPTANFLTNWGTWWMGDALGVFIFAPLVLIWLQRPSEPWRNRRLTITLPILVMFGLTTAAVFYEAKNNGERIKLEFGQQTTELSVALEKSMSTHINVLRSFGSLYAASTLVDRDEFRTFVAHSLTNFQGIQALEWNPYITFSERAAFEKSLKPEGYRHMHITERDANQQIVVAKNRPFYVPVSFIEPYKGNENALGYDVYSDALRRKAIDQARDSGEITTTGRITLVQEHGNQYGILAFLPVYRKGLPHQTLEERRNNISGYAVAVFRGGDIVTAALKDLNKKGLSYRLIDESAAPSEQLIFSSDQNQLKPLIPHENGFFGRHFSLVSNLAIPVGGRVWRFEIAPTEDYFAYHRSNDAWLILLVGLILTSMVGAFSMVASGRGSILRRLVKERTSALAQSEARFRSTFEAAPIGVADISLDGYFLAVNQGWCDIFGYSRDELLDMALKELTPADYHHSDDDIMEQALAGKMSSFTMEKQYIRKNGELVWGNLSKKLIRHADGSPDHFVAVVENIDGRKQAEAQIANSLSLLYATLNSTHDAILVVDLNNTWVLHNQRFIDLWRITDEILISKDDSAALSFVLNQLEDTDAFLNKVHQLYDAPESSSYDTLTFKNGQIIERYSTPHLVDGKVVGRVWSFRDITERKQAEQALQRTAEKNLALLHNASDGIHIVDSDGNIIEISDSFCAMLGYQRDDLIGTNISQWDASFNTSEYPQLIKQQFTTQYRSQFETRHRRKDGSIFDVEISSLALELDGKPVLFNSSRDITERKLAKRTMEEALSRLQKISSRLPGVVYQYRLNPDGSACFPFASDGIRQIYRVSPHEVREDASKVLAILHPDDYDKIGTSIQESAQNLTPWCLEYRVKFDDGTIRWLLGNALPEREDNGATLWHGFITDITERKDSDAIFYAVFDQLSFLAGILDQQGRLVEINNTALLFADMPREELIGKYFPDTPWWSNPQERSKLIEGLNHAYTGANVSFETIHNNPAGGHINVMFSAMPIYLENDIRLAVVGIDITSRKRAEEKLRVSDLALKAVSQGVLISNSDGRIISVNDAFTSMTGYSQTEILGQTCRFLQGPLTDPQTVKAIRETLKNATEFFGEIINYRKDTTTFWSELTISPVRDEQGLLTHFIGVTRDITTRKKTETKLQLAANVFTHAREGIMITAADGSIIDVNEAFSRITGYSHDEVLNQNPRILDSGRQEKEFYTALWSNLIENGHWHGEIWNRRKDGEIYAAMQTIGAVYDNQGNTQHYVALFSDITMIKAHESELEHIAHFDPLTRLPNRVLLADRLRQAMTQAQRHGKPLAVAFLDLDGFKAINDTHGHDAGDQLLIAVATRMKHVLREGDTLARLGGDEFVAVLHDLADADTHHLMLTRLLTAAAEPLHIGNLELQVSASIGVAFYPQTQTVDADQLLRQADQAMYQAKLAGKNRYHSFDAEQDSNIRDHHESLGHIQYALDNGEFVLYYQPKVNMRTGTVIGAEALIRWQHPKKGLLAPGVFLPIIEDHRLAIDIGEWVINTALTQMENWSALGLQLPVSVNIGARQLQQVGFVERLREILAAHPSVSPNNLELEILETSALEDLTNVSQVMHACREIGVKFALDDFGTGYSSLTYLKRLPVNTLKIDQTFVRGMLEDPDDLAILDGVIGLATAFRHQVIAEGVETVEHGSFLLQFGCELAQGYGIARPMPADKLLDWSLTWSPDPAWVDLPLVNRKDLPLLFARVELRAWITAMENHLNNHRKVPLRLNHHACRFCECMEGKDRLRYIAQPAFQAIEPLHRQVHSLALELQSLSRSQKTLAWQDEIQRLREALLV